LRDLQKNPQQLQVDYFFAVVRFYNTKDC